MPLSNILSSTLGSIRRRIDSRKKEVSKGDMDLKPNNLTTFDVTMMGQTQAMNIHPAGDSSSQQTVTKQTKSFEKIAGWHVPRESICSFDVNSSVNPQPGFIRDSRRKVPRRLCAGRRGQATNQPSPANESASRHQSPHPQTQTGNNDKSSNPGSSGKQAPGQSYGSHHHSVSRDSGISGINIQDLASSKITSPIILRQKTHQLTGVVHFPGAEDPGRARIRKNSNVDDQGRTDVQHGTTPEKEMTRLISNEKQPQNQRSVVSNSPPRRQLDRSTSACSYLTIHTEIENESNTSALFQAIEEADEQGRADILEGHMRKILGTLMEEEEARKGAQRSVCSVMDEALAEDQIEGFAAGDAHRMGVRDWLRSTGKGFRSIVTRSESGC